MDQQTLNTILKDTYTLTKLKHRVKFLKEFILNKIFTQSVENQAQGEKFNLEDIQWLQNLSTQFINQFNKDNITIIFSKIEEFLSKTSPLNIYVPFITDDKSQALIGEFIRKTYGKTIIFDIKYDPNLIAGCALSWQGIYKDYSLRKNIAAQKTEILSSFKKALS